MEAERGPMFDINEVNLVAGLIERTHALELAGDIGAALQQALQALDAANLTGEPQTIAMSLVVVGRFRFRLGQYAAALELAQNALSLTTPPNKVSALAHGEALMLMGMCACETNSLTEAEEYFRRTADLAREIDQQLLLLRSLHGLGGGVYLPRGQFELALAADEESCRLARQQGLRDWLLYPLITIAWACQLCGQTARAHAALEELSHGVVPESLGWAYHQYLTACLEMDAGTLERVLELLTLARSFAETTGDPGLNIEVRLAMSCWYRGNGDLANAWAWANDALVFANRVGYRHRQGWCLIERGLAAWQKGEPDAAEADLDAAIGILSSLQANFDLARAALFRSALLHSQKRSEASGAWLEAAQRILTGGYAFLAYRERLLVYPLIGAYLNSKHISLSQASGSLLEHLQRVPPQPLRVITLGGLQVWQGERRIEKTALHQRRADELFALLLISPRHTLLYEQACEALCPEMKPEAARTVLHHATSALRRVLEPELPDRRFPSRYLEVDEGQVTLHLPPGTWLDFLAFREHCQNSRFEQAVDGYAGDFLPEYSYSDWSAAQRESLSQEYQRMLLALAKASLEARQWEMAVEYARRLIALDVWNEQAVQAGMQAYIGLNQPSGALRLYRHLEKALHDDLGIAPTVELQTLYRSLIASRHTTE